MAFFDAIRSKSDISVNGAATSQPFIKKQNNFQSNANIINPKTVKEWVMKNNELNRTLTDANITSSLMKKANEQAMNSQSQDE